MKIKVKVPDDTRTLSVITTHQDKESPYETVAFKARYYGDQLQSMIVSDKPCELCSIESEIELDCIECAHVINRKCVMPCETCEDYSKFEPITKFCRHCGRPLGKDV